MVNDSGYFDTDERGSADMRHDIFVNSAGHYQLITRQSF